MKQPRSKSRSVSAKIKLWLTVPLLLIQVCVGAGAGATDFEIQIHPNEPIHELSNLLTGAGIEDVNHEIYGGIYSQMIFGESFQEPSPSPAVAGFNQFGGKWTVENNELIAGPGQGNKLVSDDVEFQDGIVEVEVYFENASSGNAGLITRVTEAKEGADRFNGYEISLYPAGEFLRLGKHRNNWELLRDVPVSVPVNQWIKITVEHSKNEIKVSVDDQLALVYEDPDPSKLTNGTIGIRQWERSAKYRNLKVAQDKTNRVLPFRTADDSHIQQISSMWDQMKTGTAKAEYVLEQSEPFVGEQSQTIRFTEGDGRVGLANHGLNRWGLFFAGGKSYEGTLVAKSDKGAKIHVSAESRDGTSVGGSAEIEVQPGGDWHEIAFDLPIQREIENGRVTLSLSQPSAVTLGYVMVQPGEWGRFKSLPLRRDVVEMLQEQGITMLRYGGSMINNDQYRWKKMIGPRAHRQPYQGFWYRQSTNGWGIIDSMDLCEAAGFDYAPTFSMHETVEDMADFIRYATDPADSPWGAKRTADGREAPYQLKYIQLGNEERVDEAFADKFNARAEAIWKLAPDVQIVVGDFVYEHLIREPDSFTGAISGITNMNGHRKILDFAKSHGKEVWFDIHIWTAGPRPTQTLEAMFTYRDALKKIADGAKFKVITFEFNSNNHDQKRALANALAINAIERDGEIPVATSANCLQPDKQNDNGWDQGLLFLTPKQVWLQPPGYVTQMYSRNYAKYLVKSAAKAPNDEIDYVAKVSDDGSKVVVNLVNLADTEKQTTVSLTTEGSGNLDRYSSAMLTTLAGELTDANTAEQPLQIVPQSKGVPFHSVEADTSSNRQRVKVTLPARSVSSLVISKADPKQN